LLPSFVIIVPKFLQRKKMKNLAKVTLSAVAILAMTGCGDTKITQQPSNVTIITDSYNTSNTNTGDTSTSDTNTTDSTLDNANSLPTETLSGYLSQDTTLTKTKLWYLSGLVVVPSGITLTIEPGTVIAGLPGTGTNTAYMIVDKGGKIIADGTAEQPIIFTSKARVEYPDVKLAGQWGGLTIIGHAGNSQVGPYEVNENFEADDTNLADNSGILRHVKILNSGITMDTDKEINGLSMVGVGSGTIVEDITVEYSDDDGIELWGGTVNFKNVTVSHCTDDHFDIDDGYSGTVKNLVIHAEDGYAGIEQSGDTYATFDGFTITVDDQTGEGGIFFKKDGIGGHFKNGTIIYNATASGAIYSQGIADIANTSFENVAIKAASGKAFVNKDNNDTANSADELETLFAAGTNGNFDNCTVPSSVTLTGDITGCTVLTSNKTWEITALAAIKNASTLRIQDGTTIVGNVGTGANTAYMVVDANSSIYAIGTESAPIVFTSKDQSQELEGLWGGLTIIGNAGNTQVGPYEVNTAFVAGRTDLSDNSGILRHVKVLNSGITMDTDKEINGLSLVGVGSGTVIEDLTVDYSDDDCVEAWGGTVNFTNVTIGHCTDDHFDIDDGYAGTVKNLTIVDTTGDCYAGIEQSGNTIATFDGFDITLGDQLGEGGIFFKKDGIGGHFLNGTITYDSDASGAIYSQGIADTANTSFGNVTLNALAGHFFVNKDNNDTANSADELEVIFDSNNTNVKNEI
jgi:hypothetical protein